MIKSYRKGCYMQVSAVCAEGFYSLSVPEQKMYNDSNSTVSDTPSKAFMSSLKKYDSETDMDNICEWKVFCEKQIIANNLDYIA